MNYWIAGLPATFATKGEKSWKTDIENALRDSSSPISSIGITLKFILTNVTTSTTHIPDIDNLCEPVFSVLVNRLGWFEGKRTNIIWWHASKAWGKQPGLEITLHQENPLELNKILGYPCAGLTGPDNYFETTIPRKTPRNFKPDDRFIISIKFGSRTVNIGDISTGKVKPTIDTLFPFIGGCKGRPEDWRVDELQVEKGVPDIKEGAVEVSIWRKPDRDIT